MMEHEQNGLYHTASEVQSSNYGTAEGKERNCGTENAVRSRKSRKRNGKSGLAAALLACVICFAAGTGISFLIPRNSGGASSGASESLSVSADSGAAKENANETVDAPTEKTENGVSEKSDTVKLSAGLLAPSGEAMTTTEIYEKNVNAVVGITTEGTTTNIFGQVSASASTGTGFIISEDGYILTNHHVIENGSTYTVTLYDGSVYAGKRIGADTENDIAVLKIEASGLQTVTLGDADSIAVGEDVVIIGNPLGELTYTMTRGIVSALGREIDTGDGPIEMFQIDAAVNSGNSGGPAFNACGQVIGIVTAKYAASDVEGLGFCVPINQAAESADDIVQYGYMRGRATLGISYTDASDAYQYYLRLLGNRVKNQLTNTGIYVTEVKASSAAEEAGIRKGDFITALDDTVLQTSEDYSSLMKTKTPGDTVTVTVFRAGEELLIRVVLQEEGAKVS